MDHCHEHQEPEEKRQCIHVEWKMYSIPSSIQALSFTFTGVDIFLGMGGPPVEPSELPPLACGTD